MHVVCKYQYTYPGYSRWWINIFESINIVVGEPIDPPANVDEKDKDEIVRELHDKYMQSLKALYDKHKDTYAPDRIKEIEFVDWIGISF